MEKMAVYTLSTELIKYAKTCSLSCGTSVVVLSAHSAYNIFSVVLLILNALISGCCFLLPLNTEAYIFSCSELL